MILEEKLKAKVIGVVDKFVFPDGCLDLGRDEQNVFICTLVEEIMECDEIK